MQQHVTILIRTCCIRAWRGEKVVNKFISYTNNNSFIDNYTMFATSNYKYETFYLSNNV